MKSPSTPTTGAPPAQASWGVSGESAEYRLTEEMVCPGVNSVPTTVVADRGYDSNAVLDLILRSGATPSIPSTSQRTVRRSVDLAIYRQRNLVERFFCKLKHFRRVATRFDKLARNFLAAVLLASTRLWLRAYESTT